MQVAFLVRVLNASLLPVRLLTCLHSLFQWVILLSKRVTQADVHQRVRVCLHLSVSLVAVLGVHSMSELLCEEYFEYLERNDKRNLVKNRDDKGK